MSARRVRVGEVAGVLAVLLAAACAPLPRGTAAAVPRSVKGQLALSQRSPNSNKSTSACQVHSLVQPDFSFIRQEIRFHNNTQEPFARLSNYRYGGVEPEGFVRPAKLPPGLDSPDPVVNVAQGKPVRANVTCGSPLEDFYPHSDSVKPPPNRQLQICDASDPILAHNASLMLDGNSSTWWQSTSLQQLVLAGNGIGNRPEVYITLDLGETYHPENITVHMGDTKRPGRLALLRSADGLTFQPWLYLVSNGNRDCRGFGVTEQSEPTSPESVVCREYTQLGVEPLYNERITVSLMEVPPSFSDEDVLSWQAVRHLQLRFYDMDLVLGIFEDQFVSHHYAVSEVCVMAGCECNGFGNGCEINSDLGQYECICSGYTQGAHCEECQPLYNQFPYKPDQPCQACNCNNHSKVCVYNETVSVGNQSLAADGRFHGGGVCLSCHDNTTGINCERCDTLFYMNPEVSHQSSSACLPCGCDLTGASGLQCNMTTGQCPCKPGVGGRMCDICLPGYYNLTIGGCTPCPCHPLHHTPCHVDQWGQVMCNCTQGHEGEHCESCGEFYWGDPVSGSACTECDCSGNSDQCNNITGECTGCRHNTTGSKCDRCTDGFYGDAIFGNCSACACDVAGSVNLTCDHTTGQCPCKPGVDNSNRRCMENHYGFDTPDGLGTDERPGCSACKCNDFGSNSPQCGEGGNCSCRDGVEGNKCDRCMEGTYGLPDMPCTACDCDLVGTEFDPYSVTPTQNALGQTTMLGLTTAQDATKETTTQDALGGTTLIIDTTVQRETTDTGTTVATTTAATASLSANPTDVTTAQIESTEINTSVVTGTPEQMETTDFNTAVTAAATTNVTSSVSTPSDPGTTDETTAQMETTDTVLATRNSTTPATGSLGTTDAMPETTDVATVVASTNNMTAQTETTDINTSLLTTNATTPVGLGTTDVTVETGTTDIATLVATTNHTTVQTETTDINATTDGPQTTDVTTVQIETTNMDTVVATTNATLDEFVTTENTTNDTTVGESVTTATTLGITNVTLVSTTAQETNTSSNESRRLVEEGFQARQRRQVSAPVTNNTQQSTTVNTSLHTTGINTTLFNTIGSAPTSVPSTSTIPSVSTNGTTILTSIDPTSTAPHPALTTIDPASTAPDQTPTSIDPTSTAPDPTPASIDPTSATPDPTPTSIDPTSTTPDPAPTSIDPTSTTPDPAPTSIDPTSTTPYPTPTSIDPTSTAPDPAPTSIDPASTAPDPAPTSIDPTTTAPDPTTTSIDPTSTAPDPAPTSIDPTSTAPHPAPTSIDPTSTAPHPAPTSIYPTSTAPDPAPTSIDPTSTAPHPAPTSIDPASTAPHPAPTSIYPTSTAPDPAPTSIDPASTAPHPAPTSIDPASTAPHPAPTSTDPASTAPDPTPTSIDPTSTAPNPTPTSIDSTSTAPDPTTTFIDPTSTAPDPAPTSIDPTSTAPDPAPTSIDPTSTAPDPAPTSIDPTSTAPNPTPTSIDPTSTAPDPTTTFIDPTSTTPDPAPTSIDPTSTAPDPAPTSIDPTSTAPDPAPTSIDPTSTAPDPTPTSNTTTTSPVLSTVPTPIVPTLSPPNATSVTPVFGNTTAAPPVGTNPTTIFPGLVSSNHTCQRTTGQCRCKPGVGGRSCNVCLPMFHGFGPTGCSACSACEQTLDRFLNMTESDWEHHWGMAEEVSTLQMLDTPLQNINITIETVKQDLQESELDLGDVNGAVSDLTRELPELNRTTQSLRSQVSALFPGGRQQLNSSSMEYMRLEQLKRIAHDVLTNATAANQTAFAVIHQLSENRASARTMLSQAVQLLDYLTAVSFDGLGQQSQAVQAMAGNELKAAQGLNTTVYTEVQEATALRDSLTTAQTLLSNVNDTMDSTKMIADLVLTAAENIEQHLTRANRSRQQVVTLVHETASLLPIAETALQAADLVLQNATQDFEQAKILLNAAVQKAEGYAANLTVQADAVDSVFQAARSQGQSAVSAIQGYQEVALLLNESVSIATEVNATVHNLTEYIQSVSIATLEGRANRSLAASLALQEEIDGKNTSTA
ncbi:laminin subunit, partial [Branchiostoma belcheri]